MLNAVEATAASSILISVGSLRVLIFSALTGTFSFMWIMCPVGVQTIIFSSLLRQVVTTSSHSISLVVTICAFCILYKFPPSKGYISIEAFFIVFGLWHFDVSTFGEIKRQLDVKHVINVVRFSHLILGKLTCDIFPVRTSAITFV